MSKRIILRLPVVVLSLLLVGGYVYVRAGGKLPWRTVPAVVPTPEAQTLEQALAPDEPIPVSSRALPGSTVFGPSDGALPVAKLNSAPTLVSPAESSTTTATSAQVLFYSSKSGAVFLPADATTPPATQPARTAATASRAVMGGSKSKAVFLPEDATALPAPQPAPAPTAATANPALMYGSKSAAVFLPADAVTPPTAQPVQAPAKAAAAPAPNVGLPGSKYDRIFTPSDLKGVPTVPAQSYSEFEMNIPALLLSCGASFLFLMLVFWPLEAAFPARPGQRLFRPAWLTDLCFFLGQYLIWNALVFWLLALLGGWLDGYVSSTFRQQVAALPWLLQAAMVVVLSDFCVYWGHRLQHRVPILWRFHSIHHSAEHLDWLAAHREHPLDTVYTLTLINLPAFLLGFPLSTLAGLIAFRGIWAIYIHSNVRLPIGPLRMLIGAPELHHWHHDKARDAGNYANISPLMDLAFGTYRCPDHEPPAFGIREPISKSYLGQLLHPFLPAKRPQQTPAPIPVPDLVPRRS